MANESDHAPEATEPATPALLLRYSHHVIEHLGLKLYQNKPTNVVAELVSNGWDANAKTVRIEVKTELARGPGRYLATADNGDGMTLHDLADSYLVIGKPKDRSNARTAERYLHRPTREILKRTWAEYARGDADPRPFLDMTEKLAAAAIPEALSLAVTFAQRAYALSVLSDMQHRGTEPDLQKLIEKFPWILRPDMELLTANQRLQTLVEAAWQQGLSPSRTTPGQIDINDRFKPDFVFFSDIDYDRIVIVEIKTPREDLNFRNREQLSAYMVYVEQQYPNAERRGILVGCNGMKMARGRDDIEIMSWTDVFLNSRRGHIDMLAAMLSTANPDADDDRIKQILEFGGDEVWSLLQHVAANDENLAEMLANRPLVK